MTLQEILDLGKMGYTKEDIEKMSAPEQKPEEKPEQKPEEKPEEKPEQKPEQKPEPVKQKDLDNINQLTESINALIKSIQAGNIINSNNHNSGNDESAEQILGSIIMPPLKKGEKNK